MTSQTPLNPTSAPVSSSDRGAVTALGSISWLGFWIQLIVAIASGIFLILSILSRNVDNDTHSLATTTGIVLSICGILILGFNVFQSFRCTRFAKKLRDIGASWSANKDDVLRVIQVGLVVSLIGLVLTLIGAEMSAGALLVRALSQPQGTMIYSADKIIRTLDILVVVTNISLAGAYVLNTIGSLWLLKRLG
jgi:hypothetical protein